MGSRALGPCLEAQSFAHRPIFGWGSAGSSQLSPRGRCFRAIPPLQHTHTVKLQSLTVGGAAPKPRPVDSLPVCLYPSSGSWGPRTRLPAPHPPAPQSWRDGDQSFGSSGVTSGAPNPSPRPRVTRSTPRSAWPWLCHGAFRDSTSVLRVAGAARAGKLSTA